MHDERIDLGSKLTPTIKSYGLSLLLHATLLCALYAMPMSANHQFSPSGQSQVVSVQAVQSQPITLSLSTEVLETPVQDENPLLDEEQFVSWQPLETPQPVLREIPATSTRRDLPKLDPPTALADPSLQTSVHLQRRSLQSATPVVTVDTIAKQPYRRHPQDRPPVFAATPITPTVGFKESESADMTNNAPPPYPREAIRLRLQGTVLLRLEISNAGDVSSVTVIRSSGHQVLDQAAVEAVSKWTGQPARRFGRPIESTEVLPLKFRL